MKVRLREPLSGQDMQTSTERWLLINHTQVPPKGSLNRVSAGPIQLLIIFLLSPRFLFRCCPRGSVIKVNR